MVRKGDSSTRNARNAERRIVHTYALVGACVTHTRIFKYILCTIILLFNEELHRGVFCCTEGSHPFQSDRVVKMNSRYRC